jgi:hypothetical protein
VIGDEGITFYTAAGSEHYAWAEIAAFRVGPPMVVIDTISFDFAPGQQRGHFENIVTKVTRTLARADRNWPNLTEMDTANLVHLLNERRRHAMQR